MYVHHDPDDMVYYCYSTRKRSERRLGPPSVKPRINKGNEMKI